MSYGKISFSVRPSHHAVHLMSLYSSFTNLYGAYLATGKKKKKMNVNICDLVYSNHTAVLIRRNRNAAFT